MCVCVLMAKRGLDITKIIHVLIHCPIILYLVLYLVCYPFSNKKTKEEEEEMKKIAPRQNKKHSRIVYRLQNLTCYK